MKIRVFETASNALDSDRSYLEASTFLIVKWVVFANHGDDMVGEFVITINEMFTVDNDDVA